MPGDARTVLACATGSRLPPTNGTIRREASIVDLGRHAARWIELALTIVVVILLSAAVASAAAGQAQKPGGERPDKPVAINQLCGLGALLGATAPYELAAKRTYADAKARFLLGLPPGDKLSVTARLRDGAGHMEQVFISVDRIANGRISGEISSSIDLLADFHQGEPYDLDEKDLVDWVISHPDGSEEGNFVGHFLDTYHPAPCASR